MASTVEFFISGGIFCDEVTGVLASKPGTTTPSQLEWPHYIMYVYIHVYMPAV